MCLFFKNCHLVWILQIPIFFLISLYLHCREDHHCHFHSSSSLIEVSVLLDIIFGRIALSNRTIIWMTNIVFFILKSSIQRFLVQSQKCKNNYHYLILDHFEKPLSISGINSTLSWCMILFVICRWIWLVFCGGILHL